MFCSVCDEDIPCPEFAEDYPTRCSECGSTFEFEGEFSGEDWKSSVSCAPAWRIDHLGTLRCWKWSIAQAGHRWMLSFEDKPECSYPTLRAASIAANVHREVHS